MTLRPGAGLHSTNPDPQGNCEETPVTNAPRLGSLLLASTDPDRLRKWYADMFGAEPDADGFLHFGPVAVLVDGRDDVADTTREPGRVILNYEVIDIAATARFLDSRGVTWVSSPEYRGGAGAWFGTVEDPDGNYVQLIQLTHEYWTQRRARHQVAADRGSASGSLGRSALQDAAVGVRLPAQDLERARTFYAERLGLHPVEEREGALRYACGGDSFAIFASGGKPSGAHTQMGFYVPDIDAAVRELRERGLVFDDVEIPGLAARDGIVDIPGQYPSTGAVGERAIWFHDSEGNQLGLGQLVMPGTPDAARF
jgi:catechol 2,3-dioxygenase-like lactoylglutathione lyase family enzyme